MLTMPKVGSLREAMQKVDAGDDRKIVSLGGPTVDNLISTVKSIEKRKQQRREKFEAEDATDESDLRSARVRLAKALDALKLGLEKLTEDDIT